MTANILISLKYITLKNSVTLDKFQVFHSHMCLVDIADLEHLSMQKVLLDSPSPESSNLREVFSFEVWERRVLWF